MPIYTLGPDWIPQVHPDAFVHPDAVLIGRVTVGPNASVWPHAVIRADDNLIEIGARTSVQDGAVLHCTEDYPTILGEDCTIGHNAHLEGCEIKRGALVGSGSIVLHDAIVSTGALVAANAVVTGGKVVPENALAVGIPATFKEGAASLEENLASAANYVARAKRYKNSMSSFELHEDGGES